jgi:hypothetical protein
MAGWLLSNNQGISNKVAGSKLFLRRSDTHTHARARTRAHTHAHEEQKNPELYRTLYAADLGTGEKHLDFLCIVQYAPELVNGRGRTRAAPRRARARWPHRPGCCTCTSYCDDAISKTISSLVYSSLTGSACHTQKTISGLSQKASLRVCLTWQRMPLVAAIPG